MLKKLLLQNFKPFSKFAIEFGNFNVITGLNNMGKSSIVDCLRLISLELNYRLRRDFVTVPEELLGAGVQGYLVASDRIPFPVANVHHNFDDEPSYITAELDGGLEVRMVFDSGRSPNCYLAVFEDGGLLDSVGLIRTALEGRHFAVLPQVGPLEERERLLTSKYVMESFGTHLSSRHFRNIWYHDSDGFEEFQRLVEETWPGIRVGRAEFGEDVQMFYQENRLAREVAWAGSGMQAWLQILTYICKMKDYDTIVLDEPEVFLHSDIQRRLVRLLRTRVRQVIMATHSVDIINEAALDQILVIEKSKSEARRLTSLSSLQSVLATLGTAQNAYILRAFRANLTLIVEGQDKRILQVWFEKLGHAALFDSPKISVVPVGGLSNVQRLGDLKWIAKSIVGEQIRVLAILDSDYADSSEIATLRESLKSRGILSHVWEFKEIENYALDPVAICAVINTAYNDTAHGRKPPTPELLRLELLASADRTRSDVEAQLFKRAQALAPRSEDPSTTFKLFKEAFEKQWAESGFRLARAPGSAIVSSVSAWAQANYGVSLTAERIIEAVPVKSIPTEVKRLIARIVELSA
jgi:energy-coupling factor transporter ATP-binding protein EcfA2